METNVTKVGLQTSFRSYCDTIWDLKSTEDEDLVLCNLLWKCTKVQYRCGTGQCIMMSWKGDSSKEWDCPDASDEREYFEDMTARIVDQLSNAKPNSNLSWASETCHSTSLFMCLSPHSTHHRQLRCLNQSQLGNGKIDCLGAIDERNTLRHCESPLSSSSMLGYNFLCASTNTCIPFYEHCRENNRCPNRTDDDQWCSRLTTTSTCNGRKDFVCFDEKCFPRKRCDMVANCLFREDEYMCDHRSNVYGFLIAYRTEKQITARSKSQFVDLPLLPTDSNIASPSEQEIIDPSTDYVIDSDLSAAALLTPYLCNRGIGVLSHNDSIVCFCPPQYYGQYCQYHADRLLLLLHLNLSQSIYNQDVHPTILIKLLVLFLFEDEQVLMTHEFHVHPALEFSLINKKMISFPYSLSSRFRQHRRDRFHNRTDILHSHPYSIRIEAYEMDVNDKLSFIAVWQYPIIFDYLPVFRLAKVLHLTDMSRWNVNPCSSQPCSVNAECHPLMNDRHRYVCLCKTDFTGKNCTSRDEQCLRGYCAQQSLCKPNYRSLLRGKTSPYCLCPSNRYGDRCDIIHDYCQLNNSCLNGASCHPSSPPDQMFCLCTEEYHGKLCEKRKTQVRLSIVGDIVHDGVTVQYFQIDLISLQLILEHGQVYKHLPKTITYFHKGALLPEITIAKIYHSHDDSPSHLYLLSVAQRATVLEGKTEMSDRNRCKHVRTTSNVSSPIGYHHICIQNQELVCFHDDLYLCICGTNHSHVECFIYDDQLDRCAHCLAGGRCLRGDHRKSNDFLCLCPSCYSGRQCQFNSKSFSFTLDQLLYVDLTSSAKTKTIISLMIICFIAIVLAFPNNLFSFITLRQRDCLRNGVGHYLLCLSVVNQITLTLVIVRLIHIILALSSFASHSTLSDIFCKFFTYSLTCFTRISFWLTTFVTLERVYTSVFLTKQWFKQPHIARRLIIIKCSIILFSASYELIFTKSYSVMDEQNGLICVTEFPFNHQVMWTILHQIITIMNFLLPLIINICCTLTIIIVVFRTKMNLHRRRQNTAVDGQTNQRRHNTVREVLNENKELIARPAITLIPSLFSLFSLPLFIMAFSLVCQNLEQHPLRHLLLTFYFVIFIPSTMTFVLYIYPSSFYCDQWRKTKMSQRIVAMRQNTWKSPSTTVSKAVQNQTKTTCDPLKK